MAREQAASIDASAVAPEGSQLSSAQIREALSILESRVVGENVLVLVPDSTRSLPLRSVMSPLLETLRGASSIEVMVALGTHPPLDQLQMADLVGLGEITSLPPNLKLSNHDFQDQAKLVQIGVIPKERLAEIAGSHWHLTLGGDVVVRINEAAVRADRIIIVGPTFPHEVVGFSGGSKYLFPGISGPEMVDVLHWLGALVGIPATIGIKDTPVRALVDEAARALPTPVELAAFVVEEGAPVALFVGDLARAWSAAADLSAERHIVYLEEPLEQVWSAPSPRYQELWTAGKAVYKLEPVLADDAELIVWAPHLREVSAVHGRHIFEVGYHVLPYLLDNWEGLRHVPRAVLAHLSHVKGAGVYRDGIEQPRFKVSLATGIFEEATRKLNLGWRDPMKMDLDHPPEGVFVVKDAGETLYRLRTASGQSN